MKGPVIAETSLVYRTAYVCSALGNPLLISAIFLSAFCLRLFERSRAFEVIGGFVALLLVPIALWNYSRVLTGRYSDFDVSRREDRTNMYPIVLAFMLFSTGMLFFTRQPRVLSVGMLCATLQTLVALLTNRWIKISLHAAFSFFLAVATVKISMAWLAPMFLFAALVSFSRAILKRHTAGEIALGVVLGILMCGVLLSIVGREPV
jgi:membrane-associated phospholipid phosphatase